MDGPEQEEESSITPDLQISDYQVERYSNDVGHGGGGGQSIHSKGIEIQIMNWKLLIILIESKKSPHSWSGLELIIPEHMAAPAVRVGPGVWGGEGQR